MHLYNFLYKHPVFSDENGNSNFIKGLEVKVIKVNPKTKRVDSNDKKNTEHRFFLKASVCYKNNIIPDEELFSEAKSFEKAICKLARKVLKKYGMGD